LLLGLNWMKESVIAAKSFLFAIGAVELYKTIIKRQKEFVMSKQLLRSRTSVGANIDGAAGSISKREFIAKMHISCKEAHESIFCVRLLRKTNFINESEHKKMKGMAEEITKIMYSILKTSKLNTRQFFHSYIFSSK